MIICLGSKNPNKLKALELIAQEFFSENSDSKIKIETFPADSFVSDQPIGLGETMTGAINRAKEAFKSGKYDFGVGIESGIFSDPNEKGFYFNTTVCAVYDGINIYKGTGPAFMLPEKTGHLVVEEGLELDEAVVQSGYSTNKRIGYSEGLIGILSKGKIDRMRYTKPAVAMALISYINKDR